MKSILNYVTLTVTVIILCSSCVSVKNLSEQMIDNRKIEFAHTQSGRPTVVFETGMGQDISTWQPILDSISHTTSTFVYNRSGYGNSNTKNAPISVKEVANQLDENLNFLNVKPPYILVGHSLGGVYINMYARLFPENVVGVVLIDSSHPNQFEYFKNEHPMIYNMLMKSANMGSRKNEASIIKSCKESFVDAPIFPPIPVTVLTAGKKSSFMESDEMRKQMLAFQSDLSKISQKSKQIIVDNSGHFIHKNNPKLVIEEIRKMINNLK